MACLAALLYLLPYLAIGVCLRQIHMPVDVLTPSCEAQARATGQPVDGWRFVTYEDGIERCVRRAANLSCSGPQYYHPVSLRHVYCEEYLSN